MSTRLTMNFQIYIWHEFLITRMHDTHLDLSTIMAFDYQGKLYNFSHPPRLLSHWDQNAVTGTATSVRKSVQFQLVERAKVSLPMSQLQFCLTKRL
jgi:hypothetical protein